MKNIIKNNAVLIIFLMVLFYAILNYYHVNERIIEEQAQSGNFLKDIMNAMIAALFTSLVTFIIVQLQFNSNEKQEKETAVYQNKIKSFNQFTRTLKVVITSENYPLKPETVKALIFDYFKMSVHLKASSREKIERTLNMFNSDLFLDHEGEENIRLEKLEEILSEITNVFAEEFYGNKSEIRKNGSDFYANLFNLSKTIKIERKYYKKANNDENFNSWLSELKNDKKILFDKGSPIDVQDNAIDLIERTHQYIFEWLNQKQFMTKSKGILHIKTRIENSEEVRYRGQPIYQIMNEREAIKIIIYISINNQIWIKINNIREMLPLQSLTNENDNEMLRGWIKEKMNVHIGNNWT